MIEKEIKLLTARKATKFKNISRKVLKYNVHSCLETLTVLLMTQFMTAKFTKLGGVQRPLKNRHSKSKIKKL